MAAMYVGQSMATVENIKTLYFSPLSGAHQVSIDFLFPAGHHAASPPHHRLEMRTPPNAMNLLQLLALQ